MQKKLKFLMFSLILIGTIFGSNAQVKLEVKKPCTMEVRCSKLDSAQHDLETIPFLKEEIESWKEINSQKDIKISEQAKDIIAQSDEIQKLKDELSKVKDEKDKQIITLQTDLKDSQKKVTRRGWQRLYASGLGYISGKIF